MNTIEQIDVHGNHHDVGRAIGLQFSEAIHHFFDNYELLQNQLLPFCNTSTGKRFYHSYPADSSLGPKAENQGYRFCSGSF